MNEPNSIEPMRAANNRNTNGDRVDINGKRASDLKRHERLEWIEPEVMADIRKLNKQPDYCDLVGRAEWPFHLEHRTVVKTRSNSVSGVFLAFVRTQPKGAILAAVDVPGRGRVHLDPETIVALTVEAADTWMEPLYRNAGHRLLRTLRDCGGRPGEEDVLLQQILQTFNVDKVYLQLLKEDKEFLEQCRATSLATGKPPVPNPPVLGPTGAALMAVKKAKKVVIPDEALSGLRVYRMLCDFGLSAANTYHGLFDLLRVYHAQRLAVLNVDKTLAGNFFGRLAEDLQRDPSTIALIGDKEESK